MKDDKYTIATKKENCPQCGDPITNGHFCNTCGYDAIDEGGVCLYG